MVPSSSADNHFVADENCVQLVGAKSASQDRLFLDSLGISDTMSDQK